jgi:type IVB pilus formation R64 PilN family outer membrane protein
MRSAHGRSILTFVFAGLLAACSSPMKTEDADVDNAYRRASDRMGEVGTTPDERRVDGITVRDGLWIAKNSVRLKDAEPLPPAFSTRVSFNRRVRSLSDFAGRVAMLANMPTRVTPDALQVDARGPVEVAGRAVPSPGRGSGAVAGPASLQTPLPGALSGSNSGSGGAYIVYREGALKGLLDLAASRFGVSWKYVDGAIEFHHLDTRSFQVRAVPGDSALSANVGGTASTDSGPAAANGTSSGTASGTGGGNQQSAAVRSQLSVFASLEKSVGGMLSTYGSVVSSPATGTLTVTETPAILERVEKFIERENRTLSRQVLINVTVLSVSLSAEDSYGLNWNVIFTELSRRFGVTNTFGTAQNGTAFSASVLNTADSRFAGSSMIISALSGQGKVRKETSASVAALNHQPVPVQVARQTAYLKSSQTTVSANVGSTTSLTPGTVTSGFTMTLLPSVLDNGTVLLQFSTDISSLRRITTVSSGAGGNSGSQIQTPEVDTRNFLQRVAMKSGQTLVVSGFEQMEGGIDRQGVGSASNYALGGGVGARTSREVVVILVTPIAMPGA